MRVLTEKFSYGFIGFTIFFGPLELYDKLVTIIPIFHNLDFIGIIITTVLSILLLFWELNKAVLSHYPTFLRLDDLGGDFFGISLRQPGQGTPIEGSTIIMIRRRGRFKKLVRPKELVIRIRSQFDIIFDGGGSIILNENPQQPNAENGFKNWSFIFDDSTMEESTLGYSFKIRYPRNAIQQNMPLEMYAIPNCTILLHYDFGFWKRCLLQAKETTHIQHC